MSPAISALLYLWAKSLQNGLVARFARLRQPKYLIGGIVGAAYLYYFFIRRIFAVRAAGAAPLEQLANLAAVFAACGVAALLVTVVLCWILPRDRAALNFSEAEIAFLFPAPLSRKSLVHYRLVSSALRLLFTALILALMTSTWTFLLGNAFIRIAGWWIIFATVSLHFTGSAFALTRLQDRGLAPSLLPLLMAVIVAILVAGVVWWMRQAGSVPALDLDHGFKGLMQYLGGLFDTRPLSWLVVPFHALLRPLFAPDARAFFVALGPALLVYALHYAWVLFSEVKFEEASIAKAGKRAARTAQLREGNYRFGSAAPKARRAPFDLSKARWPELAFLWKNLLAGAEYLRLRTVLIAVFIIYAGLAWVTRHPDLEWLQFTAGLCAMIGIPYLLVFGPMTARQDLRSDLLNADILKIYPLRGWQIVLGELLQPLAILTVMIWLLLLIAALASQPLRPEVLTPQFRATMAIGIGLLVVPLCALQLLVMNAAAVLFPAWLQTSRNQAQRGIEVMGQRIVFLVGQLLVIGVALLPAMIAAGAVLFVTQWMVGMTVGIVLAGITALAILGAEVWFGVLWLGARFDHFDLSAELRP